MQNSDDETGCTGVKNIKPHIMVNLGEYDSIVNCIEISQDRIQSYNLVLIELYFMFSSDPIHLNKTNFRKKIRTTVTRK
jgi:hypothetical protein